MTTDSLLIDCDGHILEPPDLWEQYLDPAYRDRALRIRVDPDDGYEYLEVDTKRSKLTRPGTLGNLGGMGKQVDEATELRQRAMRGEIRPEEVRAIRPGPELTYLKGAAFGTMDMKERVELLDREHMDKAILYPTLGLLWEAELLDPELSAAYCRAYNRWIADFCRDSGGRLVPIAHVSLGDPQEAAREIERAVADGCQGVFVSPFTISRIPHGDPRHDIVFATAQDCDIPFAIHPTFEPPEWGIHQRYDKIRLGHVVCGPVRRSGRTARFWHLVSMGPCLNVSRVCGSSSWNRKPAGSAIFSTGRTPSSRARRLGRPCVSRKNRRTTSNGSVTFPQTPKSVPSPP